MDYGTFVTFLTDKTTVVVSNKNGFEKILDKMNVEKEIFLTLLKDFITFVEEEVGNQSCIVVEPRVDEKAGGVFIDVFIRRKHISENSRNSINEFLLKTFPHEWVNYVNVEFQEG